MDVTATVTVRRSGNTIASPGPSYPSGRSYPSVKRNRGRLPARALVETIARNPNRRLRPGADLEPGVLYVRAVQQPAHQGSQGWLPLQEVSVRLDVHPATPK